MNFSKCWNKLTIGLLFVAFNQLLSDKDWDGLGKSFARLVGYERLPEDATTQEHLANMAKASNNAADMVSTGVEEGYKAEVTGRAGAVAVGAILKMGGGFIRLGIDKYGRTTAVRVNLPSRNIWKLTTEGADKIMQHGSFGKFYRSASDGLWWAEDLAGHGGSSFKVFTETKAGLQWFRDADKFGDFISGKHKGSTGMFIPWKELSGR